MADVFTIIERSRIMGRIRGRGNKSTELRFMRLMRKHKISGWRRGSKLVGKPDFVFSKRRVTVFIDGDFWHGNPVKFRLPKSNIDYWKKKILNNRKRDKSITKLLTADGWKVVRIWESSLRDGEGILAKLKLLI